MRKKFYHLNKVTLGAFSSKASGSHCFLLSVSAWRRNSMHLKRKYFFFFYMFVIFVHLGRSCFFWSQRRCHSRGEGRDPSTPSGQRLHLTLNDSTFLSLEKRGAAHFGVNWWDITTDQRHIVLLKMLSNGWDYESPASPPPHFGQNSNFFRKISERGSSPENWT